LRSRHFTETDGNILEILKIKHASGAVWSQKRTLACLARQAYIHISPCRRSSSSVSKFPDRLARMNKMLADRGARRWPLKPLESTLNDVLAEADMQSTSKRRRIAAADDDVDMLSILLKITAKSAQSRTPRSRE
jgi:hypothetical protein